MNKKEKSSYESHVLKAKDHMENYKFDDAYNEYKIAAEIKRNALGKEHIEVSTCYSQCGTALYKAGRYDQALDCYK